MAPEPGIPITHDDLKTFHALHFSGPTSLQFVQTFFGELGPSGAPETLQKQDDALDDGLGYYSDGVKRTLTDEQVAIFRHSEIQSILRERRHAAEGKTGREQDAHTATDADLEEGELGEDAGQTAEAHAPLMATSAQKVKPKCNDKPKKKSWFKQNVKPDLRKRTWDKVDQGLDALDYNDEVQVDASTTRTQSQRRKISYDDD